MQIELIETYLDLMETSSFNRTAERLGLKQSTISNRVNTLEAAVGQKLFARSRAGTRPTAAGQRFLDHARALRHEWNEARRDVAMTGNFSHAVRISMQTDLAANHIGDWVAWFRQALPKASLYIELDYSAQMIADLLAGDIDLAVMFTPRYMPDLHYEAVGDVRYRMVSTSASRFAEVDPATFIFANYSSAFNKTQREIAAGFSGAAVASGQNAAICGLLGSIGGTAFVLEEAANALIESGAAMDVSDVEPIAQSVYAAVHLRHRHAHVHRKIIAIVKRHFATSGG